jgi:hypothetical protein
MVNTKRRDRERRGDEWVTSMILSFNEVYRDRGGEFVSATRLPAIVD